MISDAPPDHTPQPYRQAMLRFSLVFLGGALIGTLMFVFRMHEGAGLSATISMVAAIGVVVGLGIITIAVSPHHGGLDLLEPPVWHSIWSFISIALPTIFVFEEITPFGISWNRAPIDWIPQGLAFFLVGLSVLWIGYWVPQSLITKSKTKRRTGIVEISSAPSLATVLILYALSVLTRIILIRTVGVTIAINREGLGWADVFLQWFYYLGDSRYLCTAVVGLQIAQRKWPKYLLIGLVVVEIPFAVTSGFDKSFLFFLIVTYASLRYGGAGHRQRSLLVVACIMAALVAFFVPVIPEYRRLIYNELIEPTSISDVMRGAIIAITHVWGPGFGHGFRLLFERAFIRQVGVSYAAGALLNKTPSSIPFLGLDRLPMTLLLIVPRVLFPNKPTFPSGEDFNILFLGASPGQGMVAVTIYSQLYWFAGWPAVVMGTFALGIALGLIYQKMVVQSLSRSQYMPVAFFLAVAPAWLDPESGWSGTVYPLLQQLVVYGVMSIVIYRVSTRGHAHAEGGYNRQLPSGRQDACAS